MTTGAGQPLLLTAARAVASGLARLPEQFVHAGDRERLGRLVAPAPAAFDHTIFERRLGGTPGLDVSLRLVQGASQRALANWEPEVEALPDAWGPIVRLLRAWSSPKSPLHAGLGELWFEYDLSAGRSLPFACLGLAPLDSEPGPRDRAAALEAATLGLEALGCAPPRPLAAALEHAVTVLPPGAAPVIVASPGQRAPGMLRLACSMQPGSIGAWLARLGLSASLGELADRWSDGGPRRVVQVDLAPRPLPRVGVELMVPGRPSEVAALGDLLRRLTSAGVCTEAERAALWHWPTSRRGLTYVPGRASRRWRLLDLKVVLAADTPVQAKAYLGLVPQVVVLT